MLPMSTDNWMLSHSCSLADPPGGAVQRRWDSLRDTTHSTALETFGRKRSKTQDWFEASANELNATIEEKRVALLKHKHQPTQATLQALRTARNNAQKTARRCSQMIIIWWKLKAVCDTVLINSFVIAWIVSATTFGLSTAGTVSIILSIVLPFVFILLLMCGYIKEYLDKGVSFKVTLIEALQLIGLLLPLVNVLFLFYLIYKKLFDEGWVIFQTGFFNLVFLLGISVSISIPGFYSEDTVTFAASITTVVLLVVAFISFVILWWKTFWYVDFERFRRWMSVYNVGFLIVIVIATISWMAFKDNKQWWWRLNICNIVALVSILIALICWIVSKDQSCKTNIPIWIILTVSGVAVVITLSRSFPVCSRNEGTNENNHADKKQDCGEMQELQALSPGHEAEPENHPVS
ncbi:uncharacterized protein [Hemitrygon akajei]|uniref:uncharacterized protein n=1 Tax=Hemitrygon akajei TaxID=2704970 RepID=UPI003BF9CBC9